jgi:hypothetical protein
MANEELQQEYQDRKERTAALTDLTLQSTDGGGMTLQPTPTQEENDLLALGLMHPDDKAQAGQDKGMPSLAAQQAYLASGEALPSGGAPAPAPTPAPKTTTSTTTTAPRTTTSTGTVSSTGTASSG